MITDNNYSENNDSSTNTINTSRTFVRRDLVAYSINIALTPTLGILEVGMDDRIRLQKVDNTTFMPTEMIFDLSRSEITAYRSDRANQISLHKGLANNYTVNFDADRGQQYNMLNLSPIFSDVDVNSNDIAITTWWLYLLSSWHIGLKDSKKDIIILRVFIYPFIIIFSLLFIGILLDNIF